MQCRDGRRNDCARFAAPVAQLASRDFAGLDPSQRRGPVASRRETLRDRQIRLDRGPPATVVPGPGPCSEQPPGHVILPAYRCVPPRHHQPISLRPDPLGPYGNALCASRRSLGSPVSRDPSVRTNRASGRRNCPTSIGLLPASTAVPSSSTRPKTRSSTPRRNSSRTPNVARAAGPRDGR